MAIASQHATSLTTRVDALEKAVAALTTRVTALETAGVALAARVAVVENRVTALEKTQHVSPFAEVYAAVYGD